MDADDYQIPLRALNEFTYCPRLFHLMYVQGLFDESRDTIEGRLQHERRLNKTKASRLQDDEDDDDVKPWPESEVSALQLSSDLLGLTGKFDVLLQKGEETIPVELKHSGPPKGKGPFQVGPVHLSPVAWPNDQLQLAGQMALLQQNGHPCHRGQLYYRKTHSLVPLEYDDRLKKALHYILDEIRKALVKPMPPPLDDSPKCVGCSLNAICLPDETLSLQGKCAEPRQLYPSRDDCGILYLITPGTRLGKSGDALKITVPDQPEHLIPIKDISQVCIYGNSQVSTQALIEMAERGIGITYHTPTGWIRAVTTAPLEKNVALRRTQYQRFDDPQICLDLARSLVAAKIENQRVLLRRNDPQHNEKPIIDLMKGYKKEALEAESQDSLRGIEGIAAQKYWSLYPDLIQKHSDWPMEGRNRRPPKDPANALLSFGYGLLCRDFISALHAAGLDPLCGFYHRLVPGRPALALDLMEPFRPLVVDSVVLRTANEGRLTPDDFIKTGDSCLLSPAGKRNFIKAYEQRVDELVTHPFFGYRLSYRRIFSLETRLLGRYLTGEIEHYAPLTTR